VDLGYTGPQQSVDGLGHAIHPGRVQYRPPHQTSSTNAAYSDRGWGVPPDLAFSPGPGQDAPTASALERYVHDPQRHELVALGCGCKSEDEAKLIHRREVSLALLGVNLEVRDRPDQHHNARPGN
jgi:hypothetical protein